MWRTFDVGAVVELLPVSEALVAAGAEGMDRPVSRARLAASTTHLRRVGAGELVVTTMTTLLAAGETAERLVGRLDAAQIAGLAVGLDTADDLPPDMLAAAERWRCRSSPSPSTPTSAT